MKRVVAAAALLGLTAGWTVANVGSIAAETAAAYGVGLATVGLFATAQFLMHLVMQLPAGRATDRFGASRIAFLGLAVIGAGAVVAMIEPEPTLAFIGRAMTGVGTGLAFVAGVDYVRAVGGSPLMQGLFGGLSRGGGGLAIAIVPQFESALGWRAPYVTLLPMVIAGMIMLAAAPSSLVEAKHRDSGRTPMRLLLGDTRLYRLAAVYAASLGLSVVVANWAVEIITVHSGASLGTAGAIGAITLMVTVGTRPLGGWILHRHSRHVRAAVGASLVCGALGAAALLFGEPLWLAALGGVLLGIGGGIPFAPSFTGAAVTRPEAPAAAVGFVNSASALVVVAGTPLLGLTFSLPGDGRLGFAIVAVLWVVALAALPPRRVLGAPPENDPVPA
ncbi:MAG: MFS transporter [Solirubrobacterales bacterium]